MSLSGGAPETVWTQVDAYVGDMLATDDSGMDAALERSRSAGLPDIAVSSAQGRLLRILAMALRAERILEIGTLGGYSTLHLARGLASEGRIVTLELDPHHAEIARRNFVEAGVSDRIEVRVGPALDRLPEIVAEGGVPFDLVFIDADKADNVAYFEWALRLVRPGAMIVVDNVVRAGRVVDPDGDASVQGVRRLMERVAREGRVTATVIQTVGAKGYDGLLVATVAGSTGA